VSSGSDARFRSSGAFGTHGALGVAGAGFTSTALRRHVGFWLMKLYGHADVRILDCARGTWRAGLRWSTDVATRPMTRYSLPDPDSRVRAGQSTVQEAIKDPECAIVDVRTDSEFRGERFWPSGGLEP